MGSFLGVSNRSIAPASAAATPTFSPAAGTCSSPQSVSISSTNPGAAIYFTVDGSAPTFPITGTTTAYSGPISVSGNQTIQAIALVAGHLESAVGSAAYVITAGAPFDFFISTTGSDSNAGTSVGAPWAITSLIDNSSNNSKIA